MLPGSDAGLPSMFHSQREIAGGLAQPATPASSNTKSAARSSRSVGAR